MSCERTSSFNKQLMALYKTKNEQKKNVLISQNILVLN